MGAHGRAQAGKPYAAFFLLHPIPSCVAGFSTQQFCMWGSVVSG